MKLLRGILAITMIAMFLVGNLTEMAAHATVPDCVGTHCDTHSANDGMGDFGEMTHHAHDEMTDKEVSHECCDQISCQFAALNPIIGLVEQFSSRNEVWITGAQLSAARQPQVLDRPPNV